MQSRKPTLQEQKLLDLLVKKASGLDLPGTWKKTLLVEPMKDGGMGSIRLLPCGVGEERRIYGRTVAEHEFIDSDGVTVLASLNVDQAGDLFEVDIWKTDFTPLRGS
ncbi:MAG: hypothetical protein PSX80_00965 [bacterium]|nr:hypothetical protein [bacterium]